MTPVEDGIVLHTDERGYIVRQASADRIQARWRPAVERTVYEYIRRFGPALRSVYVRGSVPLGNARDFVSDIDTFALVDEPVNHADLRCEDFDGGAVRRAWPFVKRVEADAYPIDALRRSRRLAAVVKTQSACLYGEDFGPSIAGFRPGPDLILHGWDMPGDLAVARRIISAGCPADTAREICSWAMKRVLRSGFELVMERANVYTRDLHACHRFFAVYYPGKAEAMAEVLSLAIEPEPGLALFGAVAEALGDWLYEALCHEYGAARIAQLLEDRE
jgi:hypothetical protein